MRALGEDDGDPRRHGVGLSGHHDRRAFFLGGPRRDQKLDRQKARDARELERKQERQGAIPGAQAPEAPGAPSKPLQVGGDPAVGAAPARGGTSTAATTQTQQRATGDDEKPGDGQPAR